MLSKSSVPSVICSVRSGQASFADAFTERTGRRRGRRAKTDHHLHADAIRKDRHHSQPGMKGDGLMRLEIPENAHIQIVIGAAPRLALTDQSGNTRQQPAAARSLVKGAVMAALLCGAFLAGKQFGPVRTVTPAIAAAPAPPEGRAAVGGVPPEFTQQLQQPPVVTLPPTPSPGRNAFGLDR